MPAAPPGGSGTGAGTPCVGTPTPLRGCGEVRGHPHAATRLTTVLRRDRVPRGGRGRAPRPLAPLPQEEDTAKGRLRRGRGACGPSGSGTPDTRITRPVPRPAVAACGVPPASGRTQWPAGTAVIIWRPDPVGGVHREAAGQRASRAEGAAVLSRPAAGTNPAGLAVAAQPPARHRPAEPGGETGLRTWRLIRME